VLGGLNPLNFDTAGRITLPERMCERLNIADWVTVVGMGDYFQIWSRDVFEANYEDDRRIALEGLQAYTEEQRKALAGGAA
jgi:MraZ protein